MCLSKEGPIQIAEKDIIVYKCMCVYKEKTKFNYNYFYSPYYNDKAYEFNKKYTVKLFKKINDFGFYSCKTINGAKKYLKSISSKYIKWNSHDNNILKIVILKCIIPKGSKYIRGRDSLSNHHLIRSKNIILKKLL